MVVATALIGFWAASIVESSILSGVAHTANSTIQSLIYPSVKNLAVDRDVTVEERVALDKIFAATNEGGSTRLLQFALLRPDGTQAYVADGGISDRFGPELLKRARSGELIASLDTVEPEPVGPFPELGLTVLRIIAPLSDQRGEPFLIAALYLSARDLTDTVAQSQREIWTLIILVGAAVVGALYLMVARASATITKHRLRLAANLKDSRLLSEDNRRLQEASETLRLEASKANEDLLAQVGADIHDGPVQLLALLILQLSEDQAASGKRDSPSALAQAAMEELRNISVGLVLPELTDLSLEQVVHLALSRHERATGERVSASLDPKGLAVPMATKICAYRIVQESLNNGYQHGGTRQAVAMKIVDENIDLTICAQLPPGLTAPLPKRERLGLLGMRLRVEALGGSISIKLDASASAVQVKLPINLADLSMRAPPDEGR
jgi:signal transduction histidine kinase